MNMAIINYEAVVLVFAPLLRGLAGWLENALEDGVIDWPEWRQLIQTVLRLGIPGFAIYFGTELPIEFAAAIPLIADYVYQYIKKVVDRTKNKEEVVVVTE